MRRSLEFRPGDDVRALWILAVLLLACGWYYVDSRYEGAIAETQSRSESLVRRIAVDRRTLSERAALERVRTIAERELRSVARDLPLSETTAQILAGLERLAGRCGVTIEELVPEQPQPAASAAGAAVQTDPSVQWLPHSDMTIRVRGTFANLLTFIQAVSRNRILIRIGDAQIASAARPEARGVHPILDATLHATLFRLQLNTMEERLAAADR